MALVFLGEKDCKIFTPKKKSHFNLDFSLDPFSENKKVLKIFFTFIFWILPNLIKIYLWIIVTWETSQNWKKKYKKINNDLEGTLKLSFKYSLLWGLTLVPLYPRILPFDLFIKPIKVWIVPKNKRGTNKSGSTIVFFFN
jgi:hypothetical protein